MSFTIDCEDLKKQAISVIEAHMLSQDDILSLPYHRLEYGYFYINCLIKHNSEILISYGADKLTVDIYEADVLTLCKLADYLI